MQQFQGQQLHPIFSQPWILGLCTVIFDVDVGQRVDSLTPAGVLSQEEQRDVAFNAFPDSTSHELHARTTIKDSSFFFRIRRQGQPIGSSLHAAHARQSGLQCCITGQDAVDPVTASSTGLVYERQLVEKHVQSTGLCPRTGQPLALQDLKPAAAETAPATASASVTVPKAPEQHVCLDKGTDRPQRNYIYGFVFCRQRQDPSLRRGGEQISVVVLSEHPFSNVLRPLSQVAGPLYFSMGSAALDQVFQEVCSWPPPVSGPLLQLQVGYSTLQARLPSFQTLPHPSATTAIDQGSLSRAASSNARPSRTTSEHARLSSMDRTSSAPHAVPQASNGTAGHSAETRAAAGEAQQTASSTDPLARTSQASSDAPFGSPFMSYVSGDAPVGSPPQQTALLQQSRHGPAGEPPTVVPSPRASAAHMRKDSTGAVSTLQSKGSISSISSLDAEGQGAQKAVPLPRRLSTGLEGHGAAHGAFHEFDIFTPLNAHLQRLWHLWELMVLGRPLMVMGLSPMDCSAAVAALISLMAPLPYAPDFRPYYTIHDADFRKLASGMLPLPGQADSSPCLLGVTNLFFVKALSGWPNVLSVGRKEGAPAPSSAVGTAAAVFNPSNAVKALRQRSQGPQSLMTSHSESMWSSYRPVTKADNNLLLRLLQPKANDIKSKLARISFVNSEAIRKHFFELTTALLAPFARYFEPGPDGFVPRWNEEGFLFTARALKHAPILIERCGSVNNIVELYARFVAAPNFKAWFEMRQKPVVHLMAPTHSAGAAGDASTAGAGPSSAEGVPTSWFSEARKHWDEVELIGVFFNVEQQLQDILPEASSSEVQPETLATVTRLKRELQVLFFSLPEDLQWTCISSPARRELLSSLPELTREQRDHLAQLVAQLQ